MAGADKTMDKITSKKNIKERFGSINPLEPDKGYKKHVTNPVHMAREAGNDLGMLFTPDIPVPEEETIIPIPDERSSDLAAKKRRAGSRSSGRSSTILTDRLGG